MNAHQVRVLAPTRAGQAPINGHPRVRAHFALNPVRTLGPISPAALKTGRSEQETIKASRALLLRALFAIAEGHPRSSRISAPLLPDGHPVFRRRQRISAALSRTAAASY